MWYVKPFHLQLVFSPFSRIRLLFRWESLYLIIPLVCLCCLSMFLYVVLQHFCYCPTFFGNNDACYMSNLFIYWFAYLWDELEAVTAHFPAKYHIRTSFSSLKLWSDLWYTDIGTLMIKVELAPMRSLISQQKRLLWSLTYLYSFKSQQSVI